VQRKEKWHAWLDHEKHSKDGRGAPHRLYNKGHRSTVGRAFQMSCTY